MIKIPYLLSLFSVISILQNVCQKEDYAKKMPFTSTLLFMLVNLSTIKLQKKNVVWNEDDKR